MVEQIKKRAQSRESPIEKFPSKHTNCPVISGRFGIKNTTSNMETKLKKQGCHILTHTCTDKISRSVCLALLYIWFIDMLGANLQIQFTVLAVEKKNFLYQQLKAVERRHLLF